MGRSRIWEYCWSQVWMQRQRTMVGPTVYSTIKGCNHFALICLQLSLNKLHLQTIQFEFVLLLEYKYIKIHLSPLLLQLRAATITIYSKCGWVDRITRYLYIRIYIYIFLYIYIYSKSGWVAGFTKYLYFCCHRLLTLSDICAAFVF